MKAPSIALLVVLMFSGAALAGDLSAGQEPGLADGDDLRGLEDEFSFLSEELSAEEVVSASKRRQSIMLSPSAITVISREDIQASGATSLPELLRRVPGMDVYRLKSSYTLVGARGRTSEYNNTVLLLIDGREELLELTGFAFWNTLSIDLEEIERIEVIRGPGSALYGANALVAVVNVTTISARPRKEAVAFLSGGENGHGRVFGRVQGSIEAGTGVVSYRLGLGIEGEHSPTDRRDASLGVARGHGYLRYQVPGGLDLSLHGGVAAGESMLYFFVGDSRLQDLWMPWAMLQANYQVSGDLKLKSQLYFHRVDCEILIRPELRAYGLWIANLPELSWSSNTVDGQFQLEWKVIEGLLFTTGANFRYSTLAGRNLLLDDDDELRGAGVAHLEANPWDFFLLTLGIRMDVSELTGLVASPRVVLIIRSHPNQAFRLGYGLAFRKPSFLESRVHLDVHDYSSSMPEIVDRLAEDLSNSDLSNVKAQTIELGWRAKFLDSRLWLSVETFYNTYQDLIGLDVEVPLRLGLPDLSNGKLMFDNYPSKVYTLGGETEIAYRPAPQWSFTGNLGLRKLVVEGQVEGGNKEPSVRVNLGGRFSQDRGLVVGMFLHFTSEYQQVLLDPEGILRSVPIRSNLGEHLLLIGRLGYRAQAAGASFEAGLILRVPLLQARREFSGTPKPLHLSDGSLSDFGGEPFPRRLSFYFRGEF